MQNVQLVEKLRGSWDSTRREVERRVEAVEVQARRRFGEVRSLPSMTELRERARTSLDGVPVQLRGAWEHVVQRLRVALDGAGRGQRDHLALADRLGEISARVEHLFERATHHDAEARLEALAADVADLRHRLDNHADLAHTVERLAGAVESLAAADKERASELADLRARLEKARESAPAHKPAAAPPHGKKRK